MNEEISESFLAQETFGKFNARRLFAFRRSIEIRDFKTQ